MAPKQNKAVSGDIIMLTGCSLTVKLSIPPPPHSYHGGTGEIFTSRRHFANGRDHPHHLIRTTLPENILNRKVAPEWKGSLKPNVCPFSHVPPQHPLALSRRTSESGEFSPLPPSISIACRWIGGYGFPYCTCTY